MTMGAHQGDYFPGAPFCFLDYDYRLDVYKRQYGLPTTRRTAIHIRLV